MNPRTATTPPAPPADRRWHGRVSRAAAAVFPAALLLFAGFFFGGHLGWWSDDYWHNQRDPVTDSIRALVMDRGFFLRPLFYIVVPAVTTLLWHHDWAAHALQLSVHATVVLLLWRFLLSLGTSRAAATAAALLFMVYPVQFEALFWVAALPTVIAAAIMLAVLLLAVRIASGSVGPAWSVASALLTFVVCCLNEQPAAAVAAMPVLAWALVPPGRGWSLDRAFRALVPTAACSAAIILYVFLRVSDKNAPHGARGSAESFIRPGALPERTMSFLNVLWRRLVMKNWSRGALSEGWDQVVAAGPWAWLALAFTLACAVSWAVHRRPRATEPAPPVRAGRLAMVGLALFITGWLPILIMASYEPDSRVRYWPDIGLALLLAVLFDKLAARITRPGVLLAGRVTLAAWLIASALMLIGAQSGFRARWTMDRSESSELRRLIPDPVPYTFFIPLDIRARALETGAPVLDTHFRSVWEFPWTTPNWIQRVYRRDDLRCGYWRHWTPDTPVRGADETGVHYADTLGPRFPELPDGTRLIPWDRAVIFTIGRDRVLRIATRVELEGPGAPRSIEIPQARGLPEHAVRLKGL